MIVIPMAGLSSRFFKAGFDKPKYMLMANDKPLFDYAVKSFESYFDSEKFLFIVRNTHDTKNFVINRANELGIKNYNVVVLDEETRGQAESVYMGLRVSDVNNHEPITIFNIDTFRPNFKYPPLDKIGDGYLEVFRGSGDNWSFVKAESKDSTKVIQTTEKQPISDLCCTGLYHFSEYVNFKMAYESYCKKPISEWEKGELYIAPLYNLLINRNKNIYYNIINISDVIFCGTPDEYIDFLDSLE